MGRRGVLGRAWAQIALPLVSVVVLLRMLVAEGYTKNDRDYRRYPPPDGLLPSQTEYVDWAGDHIQRRIRRARFRSIRFTVVALVSSASALAITLAVAVGAPAWVSAVLGSIAALGQFVQGLSRDREQSHLGHKAAVRLQRAVRNFQVDAGELSGFGLRERFKEFQQTFEGIKEEYDSELFKVQGQDPPQIGEGSH